jgi:hypothetical protein
MNVGLCSGSGSVFAPLLILIVQGVAMVKYPFK